MKIFNPPSNFACSDSGTETTHQAGYNILAFKYVKISAGLPLLSIGAIRERNSKIRYCIIWRCLYLMLSTTNVSDKWNVQGFERMLSYEQYPEEKSRLWLSSFKKIDQPSWRTTRRTNIYLKSYAYHPDSECCTFFHGNLSDPKSSEDILLYLHVI